MMRTIFEKMLQETQKRHDTLLVTVVSGSGSVPRGAGAQMLVSPDGMQTGTIGGGNVENMSVLHARELLGRRSGDIRRYELHPGDGAGTDMICGGDVTVMFNYIACNDTCWIDTAREVLNRIDGRRSGFLDFPSDLSAARVCDTQPEDAYFSVPLEVGERAVLFGAGHCSFALAPLLQSVGFRVTVFDDRRELVSPERFPGAEELICGDFTDIGSYLTLNDDDYIVVMTSGHSHDFEVLEQVLHNPLVYVGVIGSRAKAAAVNEKLREAGVGEEAVDAVHSPIGTAIKAVTPEEIAVSIAGEMICERASRRERTGYVPHGCPMH